MGSMLHFSPSLPLSLSLTSFCFPPRFVPPPPCLDFLPASRSYFLTSRSLQQDKSICCFYNFASARKNLSILSIMPSIFAPSLPPDSVKPPSCELFKVLTKYINMYCLTRRIYHLYRTQTHTRKSHPKTTNLPLSRSFRTQISKSSLLSSLPPSLSSTRSSSTSLPNAHR